VTADPADRRTILIAEDERDLIALYRIMLGAGFDYLEAEDGEMAVSLWREHRPDLTLMDIRMPGKTGDRAIQEIVAIDPGARIVAVTAYGYSERELGVPVLRKGFGKAELMSVVGRYLG
jgi:CheY-like chemotaxis protein